MQTVLIMDMLLLIYLFVFYRREKKSLARGDNSFWFYQPDSSVDHFRLNDLNLRRHLGKKAIC